MASSAAAASSSLAAIRHPRFLPAKPVSPPKPLTHPFPPRRPPRAQLVGAASTPRTSQAELHPDSKNASALSAELRRLARAGGSRPLYLLDYLSHRGVPATASAFAELLSACRSLPHARQVHAHLCVHGLDTNEFLLARLVELYLAFGAADDARGVLDAMPRRGTTAYSWNALLHGHICRGRGEAAGPVADAFVEMRATGADANEVFEEMPERDVVAWGAAIVGFAHKGMKREALEHFRWMVEDGVNVNCTVLTSIVPVIGELQARNLGREIHGFAVKKFGDRKDVAKVQAGLVDMYCKRGDMISGR
ncbi:hypothetical protein BAE44_0016516 [Dichanthelium oligosanthes]|uniref:Pentatricopeptide repeat-containing protein n=1 Tax=Dichanthelium oligosanthes TaxID=888268 RepID=A0A1E5VBR1_9POAL|nr:hypothetical protein BAE44_0016516 [Dichanthelium oligosanthes]